MAFKGRDPGSSTPSSSPDASEPITLTDPDGAVTRVAPWSAWTREQVRRPGGESALVTRIDQGRLWFSSGRRKSPWLHEVHVGPAVVSTPGGRFQVSVEADGGASIACLAGRTRVAAGLEGPVVLLPDQSAAVSSDGLTLVVLDRPAIDVEDPLDDVDGVGNAEVADADADGGGGTGRASVIGPFERRRRWWWLPELTAAVAVVAVLIASIALLVHRPSSPDRDMAIPTTSRSTLPMTTTGAPTTATSTTETPTTETPTTVTEPPSTSSMIRPVSPGATGVGVLEACRRVPGGVQTIVRVRHLVGAPSRFEVTVAAVGRGQAPVAQAQGTSDSLEPGAVGSVEVFVPADTAKVTSCVVLGVASVA